MNGGSDDKSRVEQCLDIIFESNVMLPITDSWLVDEERLAEGTINVSLLQLVLDNLFVWTPYLHERSQLKPIAQGLVDCLMDQWITKK